MLKLKEMLYEWLFDKGFLRQYSVRHEGCKLVEVTGFGFTLRRIRCTEEDDGREG